MGRSGGGDVYGDGDRLLGKPMESSCSSSDESLVKRTGTYAMDGDGAHHHGGDRVRRAVPGMERRAAGVGGWPGGHAMFFAGVTAVQSTLIADCYVCHDPERGIVRNRSYVDAVRLYLGDKGHLFCGFFLNLSLFGTVVVYTLTSATSMSNTTEPGIVRNRSYVDAVRLYLGHAPRSPPPETETMKKVTRASIAITTRFYLCCGCFGYAAFGDGTPGNLLIGFGFYEPDWLIDLAIVLHLLGGYQVYTQPVFAFADRKFGSGATVVEVPLLLGTRQVDVFRLCFRTTYVAATTTLAVWFPYFNQVIGLLGAFTIWPLAVYFPVEMYLTRNKVTPWTNQWLAIHAFSLVCLLISVFTSVGSAVGVFGSETS